MTAPTSAVRPAAMWPSPPGALRVRPLPRETAASYLTRGTASPALTCRNLITYPETLTLAAALDRLPPHPLTRAQQTAFLHHLADRLQLPRLTTR
ncbi:hypothetical protein [Streptomyces sp. PT19]|uniref:hypothetical protein n=1 Tax=Streptomyces sp. PT19 TaxID=3452239 RepID=UPI003F819585